MLTLLLYNSSVGQPGSSFADSAPFSVGHLSTGDRLPALPNNDPSPQNRVLAIWRYRDQARSLLQWVRVTDGNLDDLGQVVLEGGECGGVVVRRPLDRPDLAALPYQLLAGVVEERDGCSQ